MSSEETPQGITYDTLAVFRLIAELYFSLTDLSPGYDDEMLSGELEEMSQGEPEDLPGSPILEFGDAYRRFQDRLFGEYVRYYDVLILPICRDPSLIQAFEEFCLKEYGILVPLKPKRTRPHLTVVGGDPPKKT